MPSITALARIGHAPTALDWVRKFPRQHMKSTYVAAQGVVVLRCAARGRWVRSLRCTEGAVSRWTAKNGPESTLGCKRQAGRPRGDQGQRAFQAARDPMRRVAGCDGELSVLAEAAHRHCALDSAQSWLTSSRDVRLRAAATQIPSLVNVGVRAAGGLDSGQHELRPCNRQARESSQHGS